MSITTEMLLQTSARLHDYAVLHHWDGQALTGPDAGIRFNARVGRFVKSCLGFLPWRDSYRYIQAQAYWAFANWMMSDLLGDDQARETAIRVTHFVRETQTAGGYWDYPNPEWRGRIATVEGTFGGLALLEGYSRTKERALLDGALRWNKFMVDGVGFQDEGDTTAVNYFAGVPVGKVPNNSTLAAWFLARLADVTGDERHMDRARKMVRWLRRVQMETGELPYSVASNGAGDRVHFLCYQYNAFEFMDLVHYHRISGDESVLDMLARLATYLAGGITESGAARYECGARLPEVSYYTASVANSLSEATRMGLGEYSEAAERAYRRVLSQIGQDGRMRFFSRGNYLLLSDRRSYPRNVAMVLYHLLSEVRRRTSSLAVDEVADRRSGVRRGVA